MENGATQTTLQALVLKMQIHFMIFFLIRFYHRRVEVNLIVQAETLYCMKF